MNRSAFVFLLGAASTIPMLPPAGVPAKEAFARFVEMEMNRKQVWSFSYGSKVEYAEMTGREMFQRVVTIILGFGMPVEVGLWSGKNVVRIPFATIVPPPSRFRGWMVPD